MANNSFGRFRVDCVSAGTQRSRCRRSARDSALSQYSWLLVNFKVKLFCWQSTFSLYANEFQVERLTRLNPRGPRDVVP